MCRRTEGEGGPPRPPLAWVLIMAGAVGGGGSICAVVLVAVRYRLGLGRTCLVGAREVPKDEDSGKCILWCVTRECFCVPCPAGVEQAAVHFSVGTATADQAVLHFCCRPASSCLAGWVPIAFDGVLLFSVSQLVWASERLSLGR